MISKREKMKRTFFRSREEVFFGILRPLVDKTITLSEEEASEMVAMYNFDSLYADYGRSFPDLPMEPFQDDDDAASEVVKDEVKTEDGVLEKLKQEPVEDEEGGVAAAPQLVSPAIRWSGEFVRTGIFKRRRHKKWIAGSGAPATVVKDTKKSKAGLASPAKASKTPSVSAVKQEDLDTSWTIASADEFEDDQNLIPLPGSMLKNKPGSKGASLPPKLKGRPPKGKLFGFHLQRHKRRHRGRRPWHMKGKYNLAHTIDLSSGDEADSDMKVSPVPKRTKLHAGKAGRQPDSVNRVDHSEDTIDLVGISGDGDASASVEPSDKTVKVSPQKEPASDSAHKRSRHKHQRDGDRSSKHDRDTSRTDTDREKSGSESKDLEHGKTAGDDEKVSRSGVKQDKSRKHVEKDKHRCDRDAEKRKSSRVEDAKARSRTESEREKDRAEDKDKSRTDLHKDRSKAEPDRDRKRTESERERPHDKKQAEMERVKSESGSDRLRKQLDKEKSEKVEILKLKLFSEAVSPSKDRRKDHGRQEKDGGKSEDSSAKKSLDVKDERVKREVVDTKNEKVKSEPSESPVSIRLKLVDAFGAKLMEMDKTAEKKLKAKKKNMPDAKSVESGSKSGQPKVKVENKGMDAERPELSKHGSKQDEKQAFSTPARSSKHERKRSGQSDSSAKQDQTLSKQDRGRRSVSPKPEVKVESVSRHSDSSLKSAREDKTSPTSASGSTPSPSKRLRLDRSGEKKKFKSEKVKAAEQAREAKEAEAASAPGSSPMRRHGADTGERSNIFESLERQCQTGGYKPEEPSTLSASPKGQWLTQDWHQKLSTIVGESATEASSVGMRRTPDRTCKSSVAEEGSKTPSRAEATELPVRRAVREMSPRQGESLATSHPRSHRHAADKDAHTKGVEKHNLCRRQVSETSHDSEDVRERHHRKSSDQARRRLNKVLSHASTDDDDDDDFEPTKPVESFRMRLRPDRQSKRRSKGNHGVSSESSDEGDDEMDEESNEGSSVTGGSQRCTSPRKPAGDSKASALRSGSTGLRPELEALIRPEELIVQQDVVRRIERALSKRFRPGRLSLQRNGALDRNQKKFDTFFTRESRSNTPSERSTSGSRVLNEISPKKSNKENKLFVEKSATKGRFTNQATKNFSTNSSVVEALPTPQRYSSPSPPSVDGVFASGVAASLRSFRTEAARSSPRLRTQGLPPSLAARVEDMTPRKGAAAGSDSDSVASSAGDPCNSSRFSLDSCHGYRSQSPSSAASTVPLTLHSSRESTPRRFTRRQRADEEHSPSGSAVNITRMKLRDGLVKASRFSS
jgi:hypothetical protein